MSRYMLVTLVVLSLALLGLTLVRAQTQPTEGTLPQEGAASCVTICPLHAQDGSLSSMAGQPIGNKIGTEGFPPPDFDYRLLAQESLIDRYLPVTLHTAVGPSHDKSP